MFICARAKAAHASVMEGWNRRHILRCPLFSGSSTSNRLSTHLEGALRKWVALAALNTCSPHAKEFLRMRRYALRTRNAHLRMRTTHLRTRNAVSACGNQHMRKIRRKVHSSASIVYLVLSLCVALGNSRTLLKLENGGSSRFSSSRFSSSQFISSRLFYFST